MSVNADMARAVDVIRETERFLVTSHINPDGDALASSIALALGLEHLGKRAATYTQDKVPHMLKFLPRANDVLTAVTPETFPKDAVLCVCDCGDLKRIGTLADKLDGRTILNFDHHSTNTRFGAVNVIDIDAASSGVVVYDVLNALGVPMTKDIAVNIFTTLVVDTGSFHYSNTNPKAFEVAAAAVRAGADPQYVSRSLFEREREPKLHLLGRVLGTLTRSACGRYVSVVVSQEMFKAAGALPEDVEGFVEMGRTIEGVEVSVLFREIEPAKYKISLRAKNTVDVAAICGAYGGGGHIRASGATVEMPLDLLRKSVFERVTRALDDAKVPPVPRA